MLSQAIQTNQITYRQHKIRSNHRSNTMVNGASNVISLKMWRKENHPKTNNQIVKPENGKIEEQIEDGERARKRIEASTNMRNLLNEAFSSHIQNDS